MNKQDELKHYGVLGMKWGVRKSRNRSKLTRSLQNSVKQSKRLENKKLYNYSKKMYDASAKQDRKTYSRVSSLTRGEAVVQSLLFGSTGAAYYNAYRSAHMSRGQAAVKVLLPMSQVSYYSFIQEQAGLSKGKQ